MDYFENIYILQYKSVFFLKKIFFIMSTKRNRALLELLKKPGSFSLSLTKDTRDEEPFSFTGSYLKQLKLNFEFIFFFAL